MPSHYFPATAKTKPCYVLIDGQNRPTLFVGGITVSDTKDRPNPPAPFCGLNLANTPLGNGHIMALQLGGPDVSRNIVPQYQQWQQTGRWRVMERTAMAHAAAGNWIFVAHVHYGNAGDLAANHIDQQFRNGDLTVYWDDYRIPTTFDIWVVDQTTAEGTDLATNILAATVTAGARDTAAANVPTLLNTVPKFAQPDQSGTMPQEDLEYWRSQEMGNVITDLYAQYEQDRQQQISQGRTELNTGNIGQPKERDDMADVLLSPRRETEMEFISGYEDEIRQTLQDDHGWLPSEVTQYGTMTHMLQAVFHEKPLKVRTQKTLATRLGKYSTLHAGVQKRRAGYAAKQKKYDAMLARFKRGLNQ